MLFKSFQDPHDLRSPITTSEKITASKEARTSNVLVILKKKKHTNVCKHPSQVGIENIYKMYKNVCFIV